MPVTVLVQIENLVGDIRQASYSGMPATLARAPQQTRTVPTQQTRITVPSNHRNTPVKQILEQRKGQGQCQCVSITLCNIEVYILLIILSTTYILNFDNCCCLFVMVYNPKQD